MSRWVEEVYDDDFAEALRRDGLVFVDFYADWCGPCRAVAPVIDRIAREFAGRARFVKLNTEGNPRAAQRFGIRSIPTMILFKEGRAVVTLSGYQSEDDLRIMLAGYVPLEPARTAAPGSRQPGVLARLLRRPS